VKPEEDDSNEVEIWKRLGVQLISERMSDMKAIQLNLRVLFFGFSLIELFFSWRFTELKWKLRDDEPFLFFFFIHAKTHHFGREQCAAERIKERDSNTDRPDVWPLAPFFFFFFFFC
jgi:hypothetical protein